MAQAKGAEVTYLDLKDYPLPLYDPELEMTEGIPENVRKLKDILKAHDGAFLASPEYNGSFSPLLKNTIDWISRVRDEGEALYPAFAHKVYAIGSASPGSLGGMRGLIQLRMLLNHLNVHVVPAQLALGDVATSIDENNQLTQDLHKELLEESINQLIKHASTNIA